MHIWGFLTLGKLYGAEKKVFIEKKNKNWKVNFCIFVVFAKSGSEFALSYLTAKERKRKTSEKSLSAEILSAVNQD